MRLTTGCQGCSYPSMTPGSAGVKTDSDIRAPKPLKPESEIHGECVRQASGPKIVCTTIEPQRPITGQYDHPKATQPSRAYARPGTSYLSSARPWPYCWTETSLRDGEVICRGSNGFPAPSVTEPIWMISSSSSPAS